MVRASIDVAGTGFTVLDRIYQGSQLSNEALGGSCGNVLISLALLNHSVVPVLELGADSVGDALVSEFASAGADIRHIFRRVDARSPILAQILDPDAGRHSFSFVCPDTDSYLPRYIPITDGAVKAAESVWHKCNILYVDRLTPAIYDAMESAASTGSIVFFEPSGVDDSALFHRALSITNILKFSVDRIDRDLSNICIPDHILSIVTMGAEGLELRHRDRTCHFKAVSAAAPIDTCGSGDMLSVGIIHQLLKQRSNYDSLTIEALAPGILAGQRLAAANCDFVGARGLFLECGAEIVRDLLSQWSHTYMSFEAD